MLRKTLTGRDETAWAILTYA